MQAEDIVRLSAVEQRRLMGRRALSPVALMHACIARMESLNPGVNALAATHFEGAPDAARVAEAQVMRGEPLPLLHGLPLGVKDLQDTAGLLTTYGNVARRDYVPQADIGLVARLRRAGAIVTAKTNVPDLGAGANTRNPVWGATGNPFDPRRNAGSSSGGVVRRGRPAALAVHGGQYRASLGLVGAVGAGADGPQRGRHRPADGGLGRLRRARPVVGRGGGRVLPAAATGGPVNAARGLTSPERPACIYLRTRVA